MQPHPRIRRTIKWGGAAATFFLLIVWLVSGWCYASITTSAGRSVSLGSGCVWLSGGPHAWGMPRKPGWDAGTQRWRVYSTVQANSAGMTWFVGVPLWMFAAPALLASAIAWGLDARSRRRVRAHTCIRCGYDRVGLAPSAVCPECGAAAHST